MQAKSQKERASPLLPMVLQDARRLLVLLLLASFAERAAAGYGVTTTVALLSGDGAEYGVSVSSSFDGTDVSLPEAPNRAVAIFVGDSILFDKQISGHPLALKDSTGTDVGTFAPLTGVASQTFKFTQAGVYTYYCQTHPSMAGTITVSHPTSPHTLKFLSGDAFDYSVTGTSVWGRFEAVPDPSVIFYVGDTVIFDKQFGGHPLSLQKANGEAVLDFTTMGNGGPSQQTYTFSLPGSYLYYCTLHPGNMQGVITVTYAPAPTETFVEEVAVALGPDGTDVLRGRLVVFPNGTIDHKETKMTFELATPPPMPATPPSVPPPSPTPQLPPSPQPSPPFSFATTDYSTQCTVSTFAGGSTGYNDGTGTSAQFMRVFSVQLNPANSHLVIADDVAHTIRFANVDTQVVTTVAGLGGSSGYVNGYGTNARFSSPRSVAVTPSTFSHIYTTDLGCNCIRRMDTSEFYVEHFVGADAGSGSSGYADGIGTVARFNNLAHMAISPDGTTLYVNDFYNYRVRQVVIATKEVTTLVGNGNQGYAMDGTGTNALLAPFGNAITSDGSSLYIFDRDYDKVGKLTISTGTIAQEWGISASATIGGGAIANDFAYNNDVVFWADRTAKQIQSFNPLFYTQAAVAGTFGQGGSTNGACNTAKFNDPADVEVSANGKMLFVPEWSGGNAIRKIELQA